MTITDTARDFFDACETGKGWQVCRQWCQDGATFSAQSEPIAEITKLEDYVEWMKGLLTPLPDGHYELKSFATDERRGNVAAYGVFHGTHTGEGGPVPPTGRKAAADYVYVMDFEDGKISHMTKIWNAPWSLRELGWA